VSAGSERVSNTENCVLSLSASYSVRNAVSADIDPVKIVGVEKSRRYEKEDFARHGGQAEPGI
jgi:hypothetical protein